MTIENGLDRKLHAKVGTGSRQNIRGKRSNKVRGEVADSGGDEECYAMCDGWCRLNRF